MFKSTTILLCWVSCATGLIASVANAGDSASRTALGKRSAELGLAGVSVPVLIRSAGPGASVRVQALLGRLANSSRLEIGTTSYEQSSKSHSDSFKGDGWRLRVADGGQNLRFRTERGVSIPAVLKEGRPSQSAVEAWARPFVATELSDVVQLGASEELVLLRVEYEVVGGQRVGSAEADPSRVRGVIAVFGRNINGVAVVGAGSKVAVMMNIDGMVTGFDVDWPLYKTTSLIENGADAATVERRAMELSLSPLLQKGSVERTRFECGYFDAGARFLARTPRVHLACAAHYRMPGVEGESDGWATSDMIPASTILHSEQWWPESARLCGSEHCQSTDEALSGPGQ